MIFWANTVVFGDRFSGIGGNYGCNLGLYSGIWANIVHIVHILHIIHKVHIMHIVHKVCILKLEPTP